MIKKRLVATVAGIGMAVCLTGCGFGGISQLLGGGDEPEQVTEPETDKPDDTKPDAPEAPKPEAPAPDASADAGKPKADQIFTYTETIRPYEGYDDEYGADYSYDETFTLYALNDGTGTMIVDYVYTPDKVFSQSYKGKWTQSDDMVEFAYEAHDDYDSGANYTFIMNNGEVESVDEYMYDEMVAEAAGTYTCDDPEMGKLTLDIKKNGSATLTTEYGERYEGYIMSEGTRYDFYVYEDDELVIDWYVDCSVNGTFSHTPYGENQQIKYAGLYKCTGMLGNFDMTVNDDGSAEAVIEVDGVKKTFTGYSYPQYTENGSDYSNIGEVYLSSEDGTSMYIELTYMWDEQLWNYHGSITKPLAAG